MGHKARKVYVEDIVGSKIVTSEGKKIGRVVEMLVTRGSEHEVTALVCGRYAWLYRFHVLESFTKTFGLRIEPHTIPWNAVERFERFVVVLNPGYEVKR